MPRMEGFRRSLRLRQQYRFHLRSCKEENPDDHSARTVLPLLVSLKGTDAAFKSLRACQGPR